MGTRVKQRFEVALTAGAILLGGSVVIRSQARVPKIWDDAALADWATPIAAVGLRPGHYTGTVLQGPGR